jgi:SAM-dependent methyltransferase
MTSPAERLPEHSALPLAVDERGLQAFHPDASPTPTRGPRPASPAAARGVDVPPECPPPPASEIYGMAPSRSEDYEAMRLDLIRPRWDEKADRWDSDLAARSFHLHEDGAYERFIEAADSIVASRAEFCRRQIVVDLGCATGLVLEHFIARFAEGVGIDISRRMLAVAARRRLPRSRLLEGNGFELCRHEPRAGAVLSRGILLSHYGPRWAAVLLEQVQMSLAAEGGFAVLDFLNAAARDRFPSNPDNKSYYHAEEIASLASQASFRSVRILGEPHRRVLLVLAECR